MKYYDHKKTLARAEAEKVARHDKWIFISITVFVSITFGLLWLSKLSMLPEIPIW